MANTKIAAVLLGFALVGASSLAKAQIIVGTCAAGTQYSTIQAAVNAAPSGSTIKVCPSGYPEQVVIEKPLTLQGMIAQGTEGALILQPSAGFLNSDTTQWGAQILVKNTTGVTISNLIVDGTSTTRACASPNLAGISFHNASGTVNKVSVRNQVVPGLAGECYDYGVIAFVDNQQAQTVTLENSDFRNNGGQAITGDGQGLTMNVQNNYVAGPDNTTAAVAGIVLEFSATGTIQGNTVVDEFNTPVGPNILSGSLGIGIGCASATITGNTIADTQNAIYLGCPGNPALQGNSTVTNNKIFETRHFDGIYVFGGVNTVSNNTIVGSGSSGIHLDTTAGSVNNVVSGNTITEACTGILTTGKGANKLSANTFNAVYVPTQKGAGCGPIF